MKLYDNIPQAIREGIFCLMTGSIVFAAGSITAEASEGNPDELANTGSNDNPVVETKETVSEEASDIIENTQPELHTEHADVTTKVTVKETFTDPSELQKDTENVEVVQEGNTVTTSGEYIGSVHTKETTTSTEVNTDDKELADEIEKQVNAQSGITFEGTEEKYYVSDAKDEKRTGIGNPESLKGATKVIIETPVQEGDSAQNEGSDSSESSVIAVINDKEVPLADVPDELKETLKNNSYALENRVEYKIKIGDRSFSVDEVNIDKDTNFIIAPAQDGSNSFDITYINEDGNYITVPDSPLKDMIIAGIYSSVTPESLESLRYHPQQEYKSADDEKLQAEIQNARNMGYVLVTIGQGTGTHKEKYVDDTVYSTRKDAEDAQADLLKKGYTDVKIVDHPLPENQDTGLISDFDGYSVTTESEYNRIINLKDKEVIDGETVYKETKTDGTTVYYKVNTIDQTFTVLSANGTIGTHQEKYTGYITGGRYYYTDQFGNLTSNTAYGIDTATYVDEMNSILSTVRDTENTLIYHKGGDYRPEKNKLEIDEGGVYYVDGTIYDTYIRLTTSEKVTIILTGDSSVYMPVVTTAVDYQPVQTGNKSVEYGNVDITFVTNAEKVTASGDNRLGNILAPNSKVEIYCGNFSGTIICDEISCGSEGHWSPFGNKGYLVDTKIFGATGITHYTLNANKIVNDYIVTGIKTLNAELDKTEYARSIALLGKSYTVKFSKYNKESEGATWTETKTIDVPPTPPVIVEVPPTPPTPPTTTPPTDTVVVVNEQDPVSEVPQVLGAKRDMPQVLGARRARTGDMTQNPLVASMMILGASVVALGALASLKKRR